MFSTKRCCFDRFERFDFLIYRLYLYVAATYTLNRNRATPTRTWRIVLVYCDIHIAECITEDIRLMRTRVFFFFQVRITLFQDYYGDKSPRRGGIYFQTHNTVRSLKKQSQADVTTCTVAYCCRCADVLRSCPRDKVLRNSQPRAACSRRCFKMTPNRSDGSGEGRGECQLNEYLRVDPRLCRICR